MLNQIKKNKDQQKKSIQQFPIVKEWKGLIPFSESLVIQDRLKSLALCHSICFLGFESERPVITKGLRTQEKDIIWSDQKLERYQMEKTDLKRGGQATLHAPGQLVIYPVISLALLQLKIKDFILLLESVTQNVLRDLGIKSQRLEQYAGLSTSKGKIAFFGVHISEGVSQHGLAINVNNDLNLFSAIRSCGVLNRPHDRLSHYNLTITSKELFELWIQKFLLKCHMGYSSVG